MNLNTRTYDGQNDITDVRKSRRVPKTPKFLEEYVTDDYENNTQHPADSGDGVDTTDNNDVQIIFDKLFSLVEQWQQELIDCMVKVDHDDIALLGVLKEHVTNSSYDNVVIDEASTCRLSIGIKRKSTEHDEINSISEYLEDIIKFNCVDFGRMGSAR